MTRSQIGCGVLGVSHERQSPSALCLEECWEALALLAVPEATSGDRSTTSIEHSHLAAGGRLGDCQEPGTPRSESSPHPSLQAIRRPGRRLSRSPTPAKLLVTGRVLGLARPPRVLRTQRQPATPTPGSSPKDAGAQETWEQTATIPSLREAVLRWGEGGSPTAPSPPCRRSSAQRPHTHTWSLEVPCCLPPFVGWST